MIWISTSDQLPTHEDEVIVSDGFFVCSAYYSTGKWYTEYCNDHVKPKYWMEFPKAPK